MDLPMASGSRSIAQPYLSNDSKKREEDLVYLFEAEEERITNLLSRKLERLKEEKIQLENILEAENESHVNRLTRELSALRASKDRERDSPPPEGRGMGSMHGSNGASVAFTIPAQNFMLEAMRRENEELRSRLVESEQGYIRLSRMNDIYREELIELRRRLGVPIDSLIGLPSSSAADNYYSQPTHLRPHPPPSQAAFSSPSRENGAAVPGRNHLGGMPIPIGRVTSTQTHRVPQHTPLSSSTTPNTTSPSSSLHSPFPFSPTTSSHPPSHMGGTTSSSSTGSIVTGDVSPVLPTGTSYLTQITTPPSSTSPLLHIGEGTSFAPQLSYPSVPPPSLSSSLGSPVYSRRNSFGHGGRRTSMDRGTARVAETGSLRNRRASAAGGAAVLPETVAESPPGTSPSSVVGLGDL